MTKSGNSQPVVSHHVARASHKIQHAHIAAELAALADGTPKRLSSNALFYKWCSLEDEKRDTLGTHFCAFFATTPEQSLRSASRRIASGLAAGERPGYGNAAASHSPALLTWLEKYSYAQQEGTGCRRGGGKEGAMALCAHSIAIATTSYRTHLSTTTVVAADARDNALHFWIAH